MTGMSVFISHLKSYKIYAAAIVIASEKVLEMFH